MGRIEVKEKSLAKAYNELLLEMWMHLREGVWEIPLLPCKAYNTNRYSTSGVMIVDEPLAEPMISVCGIHDPHSLQQYTMEILDGILDFEIKKGNWKYTYHDRMVSPVDQIDAVVKELKEDLYSRRAVISIRALCDIGSSDPACMQNIQFLYDGSALNMYVLFRSNDLVKATFMNAYALIRLGERVSKMVGVQMGSYTHMVNDLHVYRQDYEQLKKYAVRITEAPNACCEYYRNAWDELMESEILAIESMVEELKRN
jgi:thymidylate synthase